MPEPIEYGTSQPAGDPTLGNTLLLLIVWCAGLISWGLWIFLLVVLMARIF